MRKNGTLWSFLSLDRLLLFLSFWQDSPHLNIWTVELLDIWTFEYLNSWIFEYLNSWTFQHLDIWTVDYLNSWLFEQLNICLMLTKSSPESGLDYIPPSQAIPLQVDHFVCISIFSRENKFVLYWMLFFMHLFNVLKNVQEQNGTNGKASNGNGCPARDPYEDLVRMFTRA